jgi:uncharacterized protein (DUF2126 family)
VIKTALSTQVRQGHLYVFLPPLQLLEDFISLVAAIESTASGARRARAARRLCATRRSAPRAFAITPDPGVIEVNIHPASDWDELSDR